MYTLILGKYYSVQDVILNSFRIENIVSDDTRINSVLINDENEIDLNHDEETYMSLLRDVAIRLSTDDDDTDSDTNDTFELDKELECKYFEAICKRIADMTYNIIDDYPDLDEKFRSGDNVDKQHIINSFTDMLFIRILCTRWEDVVSSISAA